jgi:hypothetical protein
MTSMPKIHVFVIPAYAGIQVLHTKHDFVIPAYAGIQALHTKYDFVIPGYAGIQVLHTISEYLFCGIKSLLARSDPDINLPSVGSVPQSSLSSRPASSF